MISIVSIVTKSAWQTIITHTKKSRDVANAIEQHNIVLPANIDVFDLNIDQKSYLMSLMSSNMNNLIILPTTDLKDYYFQISNNEKIKMHDKVIVIDEKNEIDFDQVPRKYSVAQVLNNSKIADGLYWFSDGCEKITANTDKTVDYIGWFELLFTNEEKIKVTDRYFFENNSIRAIDTYFMTLFKKVGFVEIVYDSSKCSNIKLFEKNAKKENVRYVLHSTTGHKNHARSIELKKYIIHLDDGIDTFSKSIPKERTRIELKLKK